MKNMINITTIAEYMDPMPYAHRHDVRATRKPNAKGERNGEMMKPIVQMLIYRGVGSGLVAIDNRNNYLPRLEVEWVHIRNNIESLER